jgi:cytochrome P450
MGVLSQVHDELAAQAAQSLTGLEGWSDPYPFYDQLRRFAPVYFDGSLGIYLISRYQNCREALTSPLIHTPDRSWPDRTMPDWREHSSAEWCFTSLPFEDRVNHARIRKLVNKAFTRRRVESLMPKIQQIVSELLDALSERLVDGAVVDLQDAVGFRLPVSVIAALVGVPDDDLERFRWVFGHILRVMDLPADEDNRNRADVEVREVRAYFADLLRWRHNHPGDDLISALLQAKDDGEEVSTEELLSLIILLFAGGFETTTLTIGTGTHALLSDPEQRDLVSSDRSLAAGAAREALRWDCAVQRAVRMAAEDVEIGDVVIPAGSIVGPLLGAANRDPEAYDDPDRFDVRRSGPRPLTFGGGAYGCLGLALAELELEVYFAELTNRFPHLEVAGEPRRREGFYVRGLDTLPVAIGTRNLAGV